MYFECVYLALSENRINTGFVKKITIIRNNTFIRLHKSLPHFHSFECVEHQIFDSSRGKGSPFGTSLNMPQIPTVPILARMTDMPSTHVALVFLAACALLIFLSLREIFAPVHLQTIFKRKQWRLPPGPPGYPLIGNLLDLRYARRSTPTLIQYVQRLPSTRLLHSLRPANVITLSSPPSLRSAK